MSAAALAFVTGMLLAWARGHPAWVRPAAVVALAVGAIAGLTLPDLDQQLDWLLDHRDGLTHSLLPAGLCWLRHWLRPLGGGLGLGIGLHLAADCFPERMIGYATVKLPLAGSLGDLSWPWLAANALGGGLLFVLAARRLTPQAWLWLPLGGAALLGLAYLSQVDGGWWVILVALLVGWAGLRFRALSSAVAPGKRRA